MIRFGLKAVGAAVLVGLSGLTASAQLVTYNPGGVILNATSVPVASTAANIGASSLTASGATAIGVAGAFRGAGFSTSGSPSNTGFTFTMTPTTSGTIDFTGSQFSFAGFRGANGPLKFDLISDITGATTTLGTATTLTTQSSYTLGLSGTASVTGGQAYTFFLDGYNATVGLVNTFDLNNATTLGGTFTPVPEPATVGLLATLGLGLVRLRRRLV